MFTTEKINIELNYFKKLHETFNVKLGEKNKLVKDVEDRVLYMLLSASLAMDISEEEFFDSFVITDKALTNKQEILIDAYALIDTEDSKEKHLHFFQYKLFNDEGHAASPKEVYDFTSLINDFFLHPELNKEIKNNVLNEIKTKTVSYLNSNRKNKIKYKCHYINNAKGITKVNQKDFELLNRFNFDKESHGFDVQVYGIKEIEDLALEGKIKVDSEIIVLENDNQYAYRFEDNSIKTGLGLPGKSIVGMVNVNELIRLQNKYHSNQLYSENIRLYLGDRQAVNRDIIKTITSDDSQWFPYMNNGISIICDKLILGTPTQKGLSIEMQNMQIINGCQTVNALYNAKYGEETKNYFKASKVLIKIYQIEPNQERFKLSIIKATNNQNAVKTSALVANDPIQKAIQSKLSILGYLYDRKGEAKSLNREEKVVNMVNAALAYRAVYWFAARELRSGIGQGRVFKDEEYKKLFDSSDIDDSLQVSKLSIELLVSSVLIDNIRVLINLNSTKYSKNLPVFNKSLYYFCGLYYAIYQSEIDVLINNLIALVEENIPQKIKNNNAIKEFETTIHLNFENVVNIYSEFYNNIDVNKIDIDNLLKSSNFGNAFLEIKYIKSSQNYNNRGINKSV